jgi:hypothetical protein
MSKCWQDKAPLCPLPPSLWDILQLPWEQWVHSFKVWQPRSKVIFPLKRRQVRVAEKGVCPWCGSLAQMQGGSWKNLVWGTTVKEEDKTRTRSLRKGSPKRGNQCSNFCERQHRGKKLQVTWICMFFLLSVRVESWLSVCDRRQMECEHFILFIDDVAKQILSLTHTHTKFSFKKIYRGPIILD